MNPVYAVWWRFCDDARFLVRFVAARSGRVAMTGVVARWVLHVLAGNPVHVVSFVVLVLVLPLFAAVLVWVPVVLVFEVWYQLRLVDGSGSWLHGWRLWWRVRRSVPAEWAESAVKSTGIKSPLGGEARSSSRLRPVADHPKMGWWPRVEWPVASAWCGHPPGRTSGAFNEFARVIAANILRVDNVEFDFARDRDSVGRVQVTFVDVLATPVSPAASRVDSLGDGPRLRVVDGEAS
ncbi:MAG: hypothetical protein ACRBI6_16120 [Acidimicrobiales bacterium]